MTTRPSSTTGSFQSTPPMRRATGSVGMLQGGGKVSIHAPHAEGDMMYS